MSAETWDSIADWYAEKLRSGSALHDFARDLLLDALPGDLTGHGVLDVGCGEGIITRAVAARGAASHGIDPSERLIEYARAAEKARPAGVKYAVDDGRTLATIADASMDWVTAGLAYNNVPDLPAAFAAARRVLKPGGGLAFTVPHPCFEAPRASWTPDGQRLVGDYLDEGFWRSANATGVRRAGNQHRTIASYAMGLVMCGFTIDLVSEPAPNARILAEQPRRAGLPPFLLIAARMG
ncbi:methyltransferase domain-containing protein [Phytomonospora sp. NPDC050363]|uniref:class I SAM-dependent methyltransferase n=1 Tax=Phytomonospora sp. NPDC050363 TaxID=3155642 RepID=UPI0033CECD8C